MVEKSFYESQGEKKAPKSYFTDPTFVVMVIAILLLFFGVFLSNSQGLARLTNVNIYALGEKLFKILIATMIGALVGIERGNKNRPAGLRTHALVSVGACIVMIISFDLFERYHEFANFDPARLGAQVISGIGFLGAGTIISNGMTVKGLTTAASVWVVACIGLAIGSGLYIEGITVAIIVFFTLHGLANFELRHELKSEDMLLKIHTIDTVGQIGRITSMLGDNNIQIKDFRIERDDLAEEDDIVVVELKLEVPYNLNINIIIKHLAAIENVIDIKI